MVLALFLVDNVYMDEHGDASAEEESCFEGGAA
jgi:hypothetical protein